MFTYFIAYYYNQILFVQLRWVVNNLRLCLLLTNPKELKLFNRITSFLFSIINLKLLNNILEVNNKIDLKKLKQLFLPKLLLKHSLNLLFKEKLNLNKQNLSSLKNQIKLRL